MAVAQSLLNGLDCTGVHFQLIEAKTATALDGDLQRQCARSLKTTSLPTGPAVESFMLRLRSICWTNCRWP